MSKLKKAVWITPTPNTADGCRDLVKRLSDSGFDLVIPMAKLVDGSHFYHTEIGRVKDEFKDFDPLEAICTEGRRLGLAIQPRVCVFPDGADSPPVAADDSVRSVDREGRFLISSEADPPGVWLCPRREEVQDYETSIFEEIMDRYPIDGVHMDFIRYHGRDTCFCRACREDYAKNFESNIEDIQKERKNGDYVSAIEWRTEPVNRFARRVSAAARARGLALSAAVFAAWPNPLTSQGQDWSRWCAEGLLDFAYPMTYTPAPGIMRDYTRMHRMLIDGQVRFWQGVYRHEWMTPEQFVDLARAAGDGGAEGVVVFRHDFIRDDDWKPLADL
jgi:uncharacterized lipoprotein YddW (UPF0748 family)